MRRPFIAGNWKMNKTPDEGVMLAQAIRERADGADAEVCLCVPFVDMAHVARELAGSDIRLGAQNMHQAPSGAFTGEISGPMLVDLGVDYVILGHSERREHFHETDQTINEKIRAALDHGLKPIVCCGESLAVRRAGQAQSFVEEQLRGDLEGLSARTVAGLVIAYEPIWAIGTGETATSDQAQEMCAFIRGLIARLHDDATADAVRIQYGGSVKPANVDELMACPDIDGALVGGASLKADDFVRLVRYEVQS